MDVIECDAIVEEYRHYTVDLNDAFVKYIQARYNDEFEELIGAVKITPDIIKYVLGAGEVDDETAEFLDSVGTEVSYNSRKDFISYLIEDSLSVLDYDIQGSEMTDAKYRVHESKED